MSAYSAAMDSAVAALRAQLSDAGAAVNSGWSFGVASDLQAQYNGQLRQAATAIDRLDGDLRDQVENGQLPFDPNWKAIAQAQVELISSTQGASTSDVPDLSKFWSQVVVKSTQDAKDLVEPLIPSAGGLKVAAVLAIIGLVAIAVIRVEG